MPTINSRQHCDEAVLNSFLQLIAIPPCGTISGLLTRKDVLVIDLATKPVPNQHRHECEKCNFYKSGGGSDANITIPQPSCLGQIHFCHSMQIS